MARLDDIAEPMRTHLRTMRCQGFDTTPWAVGPPLKERRVALISTAGLQRRGDRAFAVGANDYRVIPADVPAAELIISHISTNFDRTGFQQDWNVMFPLDRLHELAAAVEIGSVAAPSWAGPTRSRWSRRAEAGGASEKQDNVDAVALVPV